MTIDEWCAAWVQTDNKLRELTLAVRDIQTEVERLRTVAEKAENVVAQWRGDISRKPHIGQLREALAAWRGYPPDDPA